MRMLFAALLIVLGFGCVTRDRGTVKTQIISYPNGALVEYNGESLGRAPAEITLPQDDKGHLNGRAILRLIPNTDQPALYAQNRVFEPTSKGQLVPNRIMIDMTDRGTNQPVESKRPTTHVEREKKQSVRPPVPYTDRGKPTQAVGLDRWSPGIY